MSKRGTKKATMRAWAINAYGAPEQMQIMQLPVPEPGPDDVLIRMAGAEVGDWDILVRDGSWPMENRLDTAVRMSATVGDWSAQKNARHPAGSSTSTTRITPPAGRSSPGRPYIAWVSSSPRTTKTWPYTYGDPAGLGVGSRTKARRENHWHRAGSGCEDVMAGSVRDDRLAWKPRRLDGVAFVYAILAR